MILLNRRQLRIKVMQALYAFFQSEDENIIVGEKELIKSIEKYYELLLHQLLFFVEVAEFASKVQYDAKQKYLPSEEELKTNCRFRDNKIISMIADNIDFNRKVEQKKISWYEGSEIVHKSFTSFKNSEAYLKYMNLPEVSFQDDKDIILYFFETLVLDSELLLNFYEERSIYWVDDLDLVNYTLHKFIKSFKEETLITDTFSIFQFDETDEKEDHDYIINLFRKTIYNQGEYEKLISDKTKNWEVERIAMMDVLLMKMAICEVVEFSNIPVKVSLNEYIEISKNYSTPKSKIFINGILDKIVEELKENNKIKKVGRGLMQ
ncbi:MAG: transcription antitermination factor NusB [Bacteroidetes bacterium]|nr:transcription antitermination factor NusB [Bacteroidota bacterium]